MNGVNAAGRVAKVIGVIKWVTIGLYALAGVVYVIGLASPGEKLNVETGLFEKDEVNGALIAVVVIGTLVGVLWVWVVFGWLQNTLRMLVNIARNTERVQVPYQTLPTNVNRNSVQTGYEDRPLPGIPHE